MNPKFKPADRVRIINYGHKVTESQVGRNSPLEPTVFPVIENTPTHRSVDMSPRIVGRESIISVVSNNTYKVHGVPHWLDEEQLELIEEVN